MLSTPVALVVFNRPELTRRTLAAIREVRPRELYVIADGPRTDRPEDRAACAATRQVLDEVDWPCRVHRRLAEANRGVEANVELGLDWVFTEVGEAIIVEDDCVADPSFFSFAAELLEAYRDDPRVWQVSGSGLGVPAALFGRRSYAFTAWASVWGWATWADRWHRHRDVFPRDHRPPDGGAPLRTVPARPGPGLVTRSGRRHFAAASASTDTITHGWDKHWWLTMMGEGALAVSPAVNMVENVGWGPGATHGNAPGRRDHPAQQMPFPLCHPERVAVDVEVERELELVLGRVGGRTAMLARRVVTSPRLRHAARTVVNSPVATRTTRAVSRLTDRSPRG